MKPIDEPKSLLEVREWKRKASERIEKMGIDAYFENAGERHIAFKQKLEKSQSAKKPKAA